MAIDRGASWGRLVDPPSDLLAVADDAELAAVLADRTGQTVTVLSGDLRRTLGFTDASTAARSMREFPLDLILCRTEDASVHHAVAHLVCHSPLARGGWWRGPLVAGMYAQFRGKWNVIGRGHPNDGRVEVLRVAPSFGVRDRLAAYRRLPAGEHLPHPDIATSSVRRTTLDFARPMVVEADGRPVARAISLEIEVCPDAGVVYL
jgi:hypothetical protein